MARKITTTVYITENQQAILKELNRRTKVPVAEFIRQGIDLVFEKYEDFIPGQLELSDLPLGHKGQSNSEDTMSTQKTDIDGFMPAPLVETKGNQT